MDLKCIISEIYVRGKILRVFYDALYEGLVHHFSSEDELKIFIDTHLEEAYSMAIKKDCKEGVYLLNIASMKYQVFDFPDIWPQKLIEGQLELYSPIISHFIIKARLNENL